MLLCPSGGHRCGIAERTSRDGLVIATALNQRPGGGVHNPRACLQQHGDLRSAQPVHVVAAVRDHVNKTAFEETPQMIGCVRGTQAPRAREFPGGPRSAPQLPQQAETSGVSESTKELGVFGDGYAAVAVRRHAVYYFII